MLVLNRKEGQWTEATCRNGDVLRIRAQNIQARPGMPSRVDLVFDDPDRNFEIRRPERRVLTPVNAPGPEADRGFEPAAAAELADGVYAEPFDPFSFHLGDPDPGDQAVS